MTRLLSCFLILTALQLSVSGCTDASVGVSSYGGTSLVPDHLWVTAGDQQVATAGHPLPTNPQVQVVSRSGMPIPGVEVQFNVLSGGGAVASQKVVSDNSGLAATVFTLGSVSGPHTLSASINGGDSTVIFNESAVNYALLFDGTFTNYVQINQDFEPAANQPTTLEAWITLNTLPSSTGFIFHLTQGTGSFMDLEVDNLGRVAGDFPSGGTCSGSTSGETATFPGTYPLSISTKHHVALQYDGSSKLYLYVDGMLANQGIMGTSGGCPQPSIGFIGKGFPGVIDEIRLSTTLRYGVTGFTPPSVPLTSDANTVFLYHMDNPTVFTGPEFSSPAASLTFLGSPVPNYILSPF